MAPAKVKESLTPTKVAQKTHSLPWPRYSCPFTPASPWVPAAPFQPTEYVLDLSIIPILSLHFLREPPQTYRWRQTQGALRLSGETVWSPLTSHSSRLRKEGAWGREAFN